MMHEYGSVHGCMTQIQQTTKGGYYSGV